MNANNDFNNRDVNDKLIRFGSVLVAIAIVLSCFAYTRLHSSLGKIFSYALAGLLAIIGIFIIIVTAVGSRMEKNKRNFFLYDKKSKGEISPSELSIDIVRDKVFSYMGMFRRFGLLYIGELFESKSVPECLKPLFCYELLCEIAEEGRVKAEIFLTYGNECAAIFSKYLSASNDYDLATQIRVFVAEFTENREIVVSFTEYLRSQKDNMEKRMLSYTIDNIEKF